MRIQYTSFFPEEANACHPYHMRYLRFSLLHSLLNARFFDDTERVKLGDEPEEAKYSAGRTARSGRRRVGSGMSMAPSSWA